MTFISYAQNFEDITLWRALKFFPKGFYIDVGANDPTLDSVTKAFYEQGWCGINIEPSPIYYERLCAERARDINLSIAVSDRSGELIFFDAGVSGRSTVDADVAAELNSSGIELRQRAVSTQTLNTICAQYAKGEIHFLKIDVEGHEHAVLRGMDFQRWRPWIILIENPFNIEPEWANLVVDARYKFVHYDGINRYYLAAEHINLAGAFDTPPNLLDNFRLCYGHHFSHPVAEFEIKIALERKRAELAEAKLAALEISIGSRVRMLLKRFGRFLQGFRAKRQN
ncbi:MAG TPA: FkbM family methyltransferase [Spongiibacteraceae bacterium]|jgi:FkbM family methyltransferase